MKNAKCNDNKIKSKQKHRKQTMIMCAYLPVLLDPVETSAILVVVIKSIRKLPAAQNMQNNNLLSSTECTNMSYVLVMYNKVYYKVTEAVEAG